MANPNWIWGLAPYDANRKAARLPDTDRLNIFYTILEEFAAVAQAYPEAYFFGEHFTWSTQPILRDGLSYTLKQDEGTEDRPTGADVPSVV